MIPIYRYAILLVLFLGCQDADKLTFRPYSIEPEACTNCPEVRLNLMEALGETELGKTINTALQEEVISLLHFDEASETSDITSAIASFNSGFLELQKRYEEETTPWEATISAEVSFEDSALLTIALDAYIFTGGAHGYTSKRFLNFDKLQAKELENKELISDSLAFLTLAEREFRKKEEIPADKSINYTGFMFERDTFYLPENIGLTDTGLKLLYNQYEVSSFADGTIELILPYTEVARFLKLEQKE